MFGDLETNLKFVLSGLKYANTMNSCFEPQAYDYPKKPQRLLKHLAPEILEQNILGYNYKSDIYSIGILCCELANGAMPFDNIGPDEILFYKLIGDMPKPLDSNSEEMMLFKEHFNMLEISSKQRYQQYDKRQFTSAFHDFTTNCCLHIEPSNRPTASDLLNHEFIKTILEEHGPDRLKIVGKELVKNYTSQSLTSLSRGG